MEEAKNAKTDWFYLRDYSFILAQMCHKTLPKQNCIFKIKIFAWGVYFEPP